MAAKTSPSGVATTADPPDKNDRTLPEFMDKNGMFGKLIVLSLSPADEKQPLPKNPFLISKSIDQSIGKIDAAYTENNGTKYVIKTRSEKLATKLIQMTELIDGTKVKVIPHPVLNICRCVISCKEAIDLTEEEFETELKGQGILKVRRITRTENKKRVNTPTVVLTISGTVIPREVRVGIINCRTRIFYPSPLVCYQCCSYGHTKEKCSNESTCRNCSKTHELDKEEECKEDPFCKNCSGNHSPISRKCPLYRKEEEIIKIKVESGITFGEARKEYAKKYAENSYASVCGAQQRLDQTRRVQEKDLQIAKLIAENSALKEKLPQIPEKEELEKLKQEIIYLRKIAKEFYLLKAQTKTVDDNLTISDSESEEQMELEDEAIPSSVQEKTSSSEDTPRLKKQKLSSKNSLPLRQPVESEEKDASQDQPEVVVKRRGRPPKSKNDQPK
ncbi:uncharacterized protein LOC129758441 [Uranotaenia lowii]|uniref:uncharacterized protein LOC129758441 n=1 Tax=Uranotaenia lowii TaxID=190385 RepID=UPI0024793306|nr:uncharacterized protein LOC129758441 [Uranotaenia lowii]